MCGIAGILNLKEGGAPPEPAIDRMLSVIKHRGPDEFGKYSDQRVVMGHARLSIIDLSGGHQPMCNEDSTVWITFNRKIYNYVELRQEVLKKSHKFRTPSDP